MIVDKILWLFKSGIRYLPITNWMIPLNKEQREFVKLNCEIFDTKRMIQNKGDKRGNVLLEGFLGDMPVHLLHVGWVSTIFSKEQGYEPVALLKYSDHVLKELYQSFGINSFVSLRRASRGIRKRMKWLNKAVHCVMGIHSGEEICNLEYQGIVFGPLLYDTIIHETKNYTLNGLNLRDIAKVYKAYCCIDSYLSILKQQNYHCVVLTHTGYITYGLLGACATKLGIKVLVLSDWYVYAYAEPEKNNLHENYRGIVEKELHSQDEEVLVETAKYELKRRFEGETDLDTYLAYANKKVYDRKSFYQAVNLCDDGKPNVFIFAHAFSDSPHCSRSMIYRDYYKWLIETLRIANNISDVNWFLKPHPAGFIYGEDNYEEDLIKQYPNIHLLPKDFSTASVKDTADAIVTCQGTVGAEFSCLGIPTLLAGTPFYNSFGYTINATDEKQYEEYLCKLSVRAPLSDDKKRKALMVLGAYYKACIKDEVIISRNVYDEMWKNTHAGNMSALHLVTENMRTNNTFETDYYHAIQKIVEEIA